MFHAKRRFPSFMLAFESSARLLHFLHLLAAIVSLGSCTHFFVRLHQNVRRGRFLDRRSRLHALILAVAYGATWGLGALVYPTFRVRVRADFLDRTYPWATGLFEIKEHAASIVLIPVLALFVLTRVLDAEDEADRRYAPLLGVLAGLVLCVLTFNACVGWYLGTLRSV